MKTNPIILFYWLCTCFGVYGQGNSGTPIRVSVNEHTTATLFFPSGIAMTIDPAVNYKFEYLGDDPSIGLLQGRKGNPSNLTIITENGYIYSFALQYSEKIETFNFMLTPDMAVGRTPDHGSRTTTVSKDSETVEVQRGGTDENDRASAVPTKISSESPGSVSSTEYRSHGHGPSQGKALSEDEDYYQETAGDEPEYDEAVFKNGGGDLYNIDKEEYYRIFCENNYLQKTIFRRTFRQNKRVTLKLNNILVDRDEIYFVLQVENNSKKEYQVNGLSFFRKTGVGQLQKIMKPLYTFNLQDKIDPQSINEVVFVFDRFTISNKEEVYVVLDELENNRMVMLPLDDKQINFPTY